MTSSIPIREMSKRPTFQVKIRPGDVWLFEEWSLTKDHTWKVVILNVNTDTASEIIDIQFRRIYKQGRLSKKFYSSDYESDFKRRLGVAIFRVSIRRIKR